MQDLAGCIGIIGDVHAEDRLLDVAISRLHACGVARILCTGDIADGLGDVERACSLLAEHQVITIRGNHDRWLLSDTVRDLPDATQRAGLTPPTLAYLRSLPQTLEFESACGRAMFCHGLGDNDMSSVSADDFGYALENNFDLQRLLIDPDLRIVLNGHTHKPLVRHFQSLTVINAGTLLRNHQPGYVIANFSSGEVTWHDLAEGAAPPRLLGSHPMVEAG